MKQSVKTKNPNATPGAVDPRFARVIEAFAGDRQVSQTRMFGSVGLKVKSKVFAIFYKGKFVAKLPGERVDEIVASGKGDRFDPGHGRPSKEWVAVSGESPPWTGLAEEAYRFVTRPCGRPSRSSRRSSITIPWSLRRASFLTGAKASVQCAAAS